MKKSILIFGASSGIGRAAAAHFSLKSWTAYATARRLDKLNELKKANSGVHVMSCDVTDETQVQDALAWAIKEKPLDAILLTAGAGFEPDVPLEKTNLKTWRQAMEVNALGTFFVAKYTKLLFQQQGGGLFVGIGSRASLNQDVVGGRVSYSASKHAQLAVIETLQAELGENNPARAVIVCPGYIPGTEMVERWEANHPDEVGIGTPLDVATELIYGLIVNPAGHPELIYLLDNSQMTEVLKYDRLLQLTGA